MQAYRNASFRTVLSLTDFNLKNQNKYTTSFWFLKFKSVNDSNPIPTFLKVAFFVALLLEVRVYV